MFCLGQALLLPKQILHFLLRNAFHSGKGIGYLKHATFDRVSIHTRTETQSYQQNLICGNDGNGKRSLDGCPRPIQLGVLRVDSVA
jgi:hypothetical protein